MQLRNYIQICLTALTAFVLICQGAERQVVKIGFYEYNGYHEQDSFGRRSGYGYELLQVLRPYVNWRYEYVGTGKGYEEVEGMLRRGEVDLVTGVFKTSEREAEFAFSKNPVGISQFQMYVKPGNARYLPQDYSHWQGIRVGMVRDKLSNDDFRDFAKRKGFSYKEYLYETTAELGQAFATDMIEAAAYNSLNRVWNEWMYETIQTHPIYAMVRRSSHELLRQFDEGITALKQNNPEFFTKIYSGTLLEEESLNDTVMVSSDYLPLTVKERDYTAKAKSEKREFTVLISPDRVPFSYLDGKGQMRGFMVEMVELLSLRTGLRLSLLPVYNRTEYWRLRDERHADIIFDLTHNFNYSEQMGYVLSNSYYSASLARIRRRDFQGEEKSIAVLGKSDMAGIVREHLRKQRVLDVALALYDSNFAVYDAVRKGYQDTGYLFSQTANYYMHLYRDKDIIVETLPYLVKEFSVAFREDMDEEAIRILLKGLQSISPYEKRNIMITNALSEHPPIQIKDVLHEYPYMGVGLGSLIVILLGGLLALLIRLHLRSVVQRREKKYREELEVARQRAEVANRAKSTFLFNMSHDIRTPMNAIIGFTNMAMKYQNDQERVSDCLKKVSNASDHLLMLINDVLEMARIESGKIVLREDDLNIRNYCDSLASMIKSSADAKQVTFALEYGRLTKAEVYGDGLRINQILLNILTNAVKYTPAGGNVLFEVEQLVSKRVGYGLYQFVVRDDGIGMSQEFQKQIFEVFSRDDQVVHKGEFGTGLGMSITKQLLDLMGGEITIESELKQGTTVTVRLELQQRQTAPEKDPAAQENEQTEQENEPSVELGLAGMKILVVEDNELNREILVEVLADSEIEYEIAMDGQEAVQMVSNSAPGDFDLVLMDIQMPVMDGYEATRQIRRLPDRALAEIPIVAMTANVFEEDRRHALEAGMNGHLGKPLNVKQLLETLASYRHAPNGNMPN